MTSRSVLYGALGLVAVLVVFALYAWMVASTVGIPNTGSTATTTGSDKNTYGAARDARQPEYIPYRSTLGFQIDRPNGATIREETNAVTFIYLGQKAVPTGEINDGFLLTVTRESTSAQSVRSYAESVRSETARNDQNMSVTPLEQRTIGGNEAYRYSYIGPLGSTVWEYLFYRAGGTGYRIVFLSSDPDGRDYAGIIRRMIASFRAA